MAQERIEIDHLQGQVEVAREKAERDKEALKKAARSVTLSHRISQSFGYIAYPIRLKYILYIHPYGCIHF